MQICIIHYLLPLRRLAQVAVVLWTFMGASLASAQAGGLNLEDAIRNLVEQGGFQEDVTEDAEDSFGKLCLSCKYLRRNQLPKTRASTNTCLTLGKRIFLSGVMESLTVAQPRPINLGSKHISRLLRT